MGRQVSPYPGSPKWKRASIHDALSSLIVLNTVRYECLFYLYHRQLALGTQWDIPIFGLRSIFLNVRLSKSIVQVKDIAYDTILHSFVLICSLFDAYGS